MNYAINDQLNVSLNLDNMFDEKYLSTVQSEQSYYAMPLNYSVSVRWDY